MDKKTITLLTLLVLLFLVIFFRWETYDRDRSTGVMRLQQEERLYPLSRRTIITRGPYRSYEIEYTRPHITHTITVILYSATGLTLIMVLLSSGIIDLEKRREKKRKKKILLQGGESLSYSKDDTDLNL